MQVIRRLLVSCTLLLTVQLSAQRPPVEVIAPERMYFDVNGEVLSLPYFSSRPLTTPDPTVTHLVISQHGAGRTAGPYFERMMASAAEAGVLGYTVVIAPQFLEFKDVDRWDLDPDVLYFSGDAWRGGGLSSNQSERSSKAHLAAFEALDRLLLRCAMLFPNLESMVLAGHSAGGQYMNRYAASNRIEPVLKEQFGIVMTYIVANPSSYVYFCESRPVPGEPGTFAVPEEDSEANAGYNVYKYGLDEIPLYWQHTGVDQVMKQYPERRVVYLLGEDDNDPDHGSLDRRIGAMIQGPTRLQRGINYYRYVGYFFGEEIYDLHSIAILPGVAHSSGDVFASPAGMYYLFGYGELNAGPLKKYGL